MSKSKKICKKDEGVAIMLEDGGGVGFENKLWNNVTHRSMAKGGGLEVEWVAEFTNKNTGKFATKVTVKAKNRSQAKAKSCIKTGLSERNHIINIYEKMAKGSNIKGSHGNSKYWVSYVNELSPNPKMDSYFTDDKTEAINFAHSVRVGYSKVSENKSNGYNSFFWLIDGEGTYEQNYNALIPKKYNKGGSLELSLPSDTKKLVDEGKVTYRGMGFGTETVKLKVSGKEYIVSREKFQELGGISKIKFDAPFRKFGKGTTIEGSEVSLHLPVEMSVYVPSTKDANVPVSKAELLKRVNEVKEYLANLFGGYSSSKIIGGYASNEGSLIQEDVVKVISFSTKKAYEENKQKLINKIASWSTLWSQEAIGFELEGDLYYINQDKKMGLGGALVLAGLGVLGYMAFVKKGKKESKGSAEYRVDIYEKGKIRNTMIVKEFQIDGVKEDYDKLGYKTKFTKLEKLATGGNTDCGCHKKMAKGGNTDCGCWHYEIGGL